VARTARVEANMNGRSQSPWSMPVPRGRGSVSFEQLESPFLDEVFLPEAEAPAPIAAEEAERGLDTEEGRGYHLGDFAGEELTAVQPGERVEPRTSAADFEAGFDLEGAEDEARDELAEGAWDEVDAGESAEWPAPEPEEEWKDLAAADAADALAAEPLFADSVRQHVASLPDPNAVRKASAWNASKHPSVSGVSQASLLAALERYAGTSQLRSALRGHVKLSAAAADDAWVLVTIIAHQFQQKIYASSRYHTGRIDEGTLDALGFVRHRGEELNGVDAGNVQFHVKRRSKAFQRLEAVYKSNRDAFEQLGSDVSPGNWYYLFASAPFLGRPFVRGIHFELLRRLRRAQNWLLEQPQYKGMSPVALGRALGLDEDHRGGRATTNNSMHTLGLAADIRYVRNPWVAGQHGSDGRPAENRNRAFEAVTRNVSRLLAGKDEVITPVWLASLGSQPGQTTASAYDEIQQRHSRLQQYLSLENDAEGLRAAIERWRGSPAAALVIHGGETGSDAVHRWQRTIAGDRARLRLAFGAGRRPETGFLNLHRDLVIALRDHGCLAWGAIDLGRSSSGDMMHFDCRPSGIGLHLSLPRQRTAAVSHRCRQSVTASDKSTSTVRPSPATHTGPTAFLGGRVWTFTSSALPMRVAVFCPVSGASGKSVEVLVYAHGLLEPCPPSPKKVPEDLITKAPFELGKLVDASHRPMVLVVPSMDWKKLPTNGLGLRLRQGRMHKLGSPANLNAVVAEVTREIGRVFGTPPPSVKNLVVAGHSKGYDFLNPLAIAHADPEMSRGALAVLSEAWAFDTTYVCFVPELLAWLAAKPGLTVRVFFRHGSPTSPCGEKLEKVASKAQGRLQVVRVPEGHCQVPGRRLPALLGAGTGATSGEVLDGEDEWFDQAEAGNLAVEPETDAAEECEGETEASEWAGASEQGPGAAEADEGDAEVDRAGDDVAGGDEAGEDEAGDDEAERALAWEESFEDAGREPEGELSGAEAEEWDDEREEVPDEESLVGRRRTRKVRQCKDDRCSSGYIRWLQSSLNHILGTRLAESGKLDHATQRAVRAFKKSKRVKTKEAYSGPAIEAALLAAGAAPPPALAKAPCAVSSAAELVPLLEKHRGDIPLPLLMGWIQVESGRSLGSLTSICERGYFQLHPDESALLGLDHDLVGTNADYSVFGGVALVKHYRQAIDKLARKHGIDRGGDLYWRLVKLCHWIPSAAEKILTAMQKQGASPRDWEAVRAFASDHRETLTARIKRDPIDGLDSVDRMFAQVEAWRQKLEHL
jgi:hypothetical protein